MFSFSETDDLRCIAERKLFVGMLNKKLTEDDVREMFMQFGHIEDCTVLKDSEGKSREILGTDIIKIF
ncbi:unnamed protein product [Onchocerca flexuosa]|uniref:RRM domain-containing protein n=1 Tax=Onchocerca flexuosa TaxID=387005 RepID=A0A183HIN6_9BILA|nr:unnamed protein product [Onchocerca flexuosa]